MAAAKKAARLNLRLPERLNNALRSRIRYAGDISRFVDAALETEDLAAVPLIDDPPVRDHMIIAVIRAEMDKRVRAAAAARGCTVRRLATSALSAWLARKATTA